MDEIQKIIILQRAKSLFKDIIVAKHIENTNKLSSLNDFNVNPFLILYISNFLSGNNDPESIAKALIYPRALGTSITTSFGTQIQYFCSSVLEGYASIIPGLDIEFIDALDGRRKYCQIKTGPNTINKDDIKTIKDHFAATINLARVNRLNIQINDLMVCVLFGSEEELNNHYRVLSKQYPVIIGCEFWYRLTGDPNFYYDLIKAFGEIANEVDSTELLNDVINHLADDIKRSDFFKSILE